MVLCCFAGRLVTRNGGVSALSFWIDASMWRERGRGHMCLRDALEVATMLMGPIDG